MKGKTTMAGGNSGRSGLAFLATCAALALAGMAPVKASVISSSPTLPLLDDPYISSIGAGCFAAANVCISAGTFTLTSVVSSSFAPLGQDILADATYMGTLTTLSDVPIGPVTLTGTLEQEVIGRTSATETGSWTTDIEAMSLTGPVLGHTLTLTLDPSETSSGTTSIVPDGEAFNISSFFDVFVELSLDSTPPLQTTVGPITVDAVAVPEPVSLAMLAISLLSLAAMLGCQRRSRRRYSSIS
jgi:hypothetical protein